MGITDIFTMLSLPIHEHNIALLSSFTVASLVSLNSLLYRHAENLCFIPRYLILVHATINVVFLNFYFIIFLLLAYRNTIGFVY